MEGVRKNTQKKQGKNNGNVFFEAPSLSFLKSVFRMYVVVKSLTILVSECLGAREQTTDTLLLKLKGNTYVYTQDIHKLKNGFSAILK